MTSEIFKIQLSETQLIELENLMALKHTLPHIHKTHQITISQLSIEEESSHLKTAILPESADICAICEEPMTECPVIILNCPHYFHSVCLTQWFKYETENFSCPLCRQSQKYSGDITRVFYR